MLQKGKQCASDGQYEQACSHSFFPPSVRSVFRIAANYGEKSEILHNPAEDLIGTVHMWGLLKES